MCLVLVTLASSQVEIKDGYVAVSNTRLYSSQECRISSTGSGHYSGSTALNDCLDALTDGTLSTTGGKITFGEGVFNLDQVNVSVGVGDAPNKAVRFNVQGAGRDLTYLNFTGNGFMFVLVSNGNVNFHISDLSMYGDGTGSAFLSDTTTKAFPSRSTFENLRIYNFSRGINVENASMIASTFKNIRIQQTDVGVYIKPTNTTNVFNNYFEMVDTYNYNDFGWFIDGSAHINGVDELTLNSIDVGATSTISVAGFYSLKMRNAVFINPHGEARFGTGDALVLNGDSIKVYGGNVYDNIHVGTNGTTRNVYIIDPFSVEGGVLNPQLIIGSYANYTYVDLGLQYTDGTLVTSTTITDNGQSTMIVGSKFFNTAMRYTFGSPLYFANTAYFGTYPRVMYADARSRVEATNGGTACWQSISTGIANGYFCTDSSGDVVVRPDTQTSIIKIKAAANDLAMTFDANANVQGNSNDIYGYSNINATSFAEDGTLLSDKYVDETGDTMSGQLRVDYASAKIIIDGDSASDGTLQVMSSGIASGYLKVLGSGGYLVLQPDSATSVVRISPSANQLAIDINASGVAKINNGFTGTCADGTSLTVVGGVITGCS